MKTATISFCCYRRNSVANLLPIWKTTVSLKAALNQMWTRNKFCFDKNNRTINLININDNHNFSCNI